MKKLLSIAAALLLFTATWIPTSAVSPEDYAAEELAALISFYQFSITLEDGRTKLPNTEYAALSFDPNSPWEYPGIRWSDTVPHSVRDIDFSAYPKLSGKLDVSKMSRLESIDVSGTEIDWVIFGTNTALREVHAVDSSILSLNLSGCTGVKTVDCSGSFVQQLTLPENLTLERLYCDNNFLTYNTLPPPGCAADYRYAPQRKAFFIGQSKVNGLEINSKADMTGYNAETITWYAADGTVLSGVTEVKPQIYEFEGLNVEDGIYAVMENPAFPELTLITDTITITPNSKIVWVMFLTAAFGFFLLFFALRYIAAKRQGTALITDPYTDKLADIWDACINRITSRLRRRK